MIGVPSNTPAFFDRIELLKAKGKAAAESNRAQIERNVRVHDRYQASWAMRACGRLKYEN